MQTHTYITAERRTTEGGGEKRGLTDETEVKQRRSGKGTGAKEPPAGDSGKEEWAVDSSLGPAD